MMKPLICLLLLMSSVSGCATWRNEPQNPQGTAAAILDAAQTPAKTHAAALADGTLEEARDTGLLLITILSCHWRSCPKEEH